MNAFDCGAVYDYAREPVFKLGTVLHDGVALGSDSEYAPGVISIGSAGLERRLVHVAEGLAETDLLTKQTLNDYPSQLPVMLQLDAIEAEVAELERLVYILADNGLTKSGGGAIGMPLLLLLLLLVGHYAIRKQSQY